MNSATVYLLVKFFHVLLAIVAFGANMTYGVWFARVNANPAFASTALRGIKFIDDYIANPAYLLLLPTGALMVWLGHIGFGTRWVSWAMALWVVAIVVAYAFYTPTLTKQIAAVERAGLTDPEAVRLATRGQVLAGILAVLVLAIYTLMIFKPQ
ncbi:MAG TPA: DUF2269 family protein [Candidatus Baltobacteraceae bacterium]|nr:DUF2269 family protein [Candidatus Baltobacteraceae bacterium]